uniref:Uncharacterized protein n=1 Tax=Oryza nivara TaxID=4536 RepID=A0A0E0IIT1_ORYNI
MVAPPPPCRPLILFFPQVTASPAHSLLSCPPPPGTRAAAVAASLSCGRHPLALAAASANEEAGTTGSGDSGLLAGRSGHSEARGSRPAVAAARSLRSAVAAVRSARYAVAIARSKGMPSMPAFLAAPSLPPALLATPAPAPARRGGRGCRIRQPRCPRRPIWSPGVDGKRYHSRLIGTVSSTRKVPLSSTRFGGGQKGIVTIERNNVWIRISVSTSRQRIQHQPSTSHDASMGLNSSSVLITREDNEIKIRNHLFGCIKLTSLSCSKILCSNQCLNYRLADWAQELGIFIELSFYFIAYISPHTMETVIQFHLYHYT